MEDWTKHISSDGADEISDKMVDWICDHAKDLKAQAIKNNCSIADYLLAELNKIARGW